ncbi:tetratricopeptide repeat protein [Halocola ammonii]
MKYLASILTVATLLVAFSSFSQNDDSLEEVREKFKGVEDPQKIMNIANSLNVEGEALNYADYEKGMAQLDLNRVQDAFQTFSTIVERDPNNYFGYLGQGSTLLNVGQYDNCITVLTRAIEVAEADSLKAVAKFNRATCHNRVGNKDLALADLEEAYATDTNDVGFINNLAMHYGDIGRNEEALALVKRLVELDPDFEGAYSNLGFQLSEMERYEEAEDAFKKGLERHPDSPYILNNYGFVLYKLGKNRQAKKNIKKSLRKMETNAYAYRNLAIIAIDEEDFDDACENIQLALKYNFTELYGPEVEKLKEKHCIND